MLFWNLGVFIIKFGEVNLNLQLATVTVTITRRILLISSGLWTSKCLIVNSEVEQWKYLQANKLFRYELQLKSIYFVPFLPSLRNVQLNQRRQRIDFYFFAPPSLSLLLAAVNTLNKPNFQRETCLNLSCIHRHETRRDPENTPW